MAGAGAAGAASSANAAPAVLVEASSASRAAGSMELCADGGGSWVMGWAAVCTMHARMHVGTSSKAHSSCGGCWLAPPTRPREPRWPRGAASGSVLRAMLLLLWRRVRASVRACVCVALAMGRRGPEAPQPRGCVRVAG